MPKKTEVVAELPEPKQVSDSLELPFRDGMVTVPRERGKWPTRAILALQEGGSANVLKAMELVLGPQQWGHVVDSEIAEFDDFCEVFADSVLKEVFKA